MKTYIITHDGKIAWNWDKPSERIELTDADAFIKEQEANGNKVVDDRNSIPAFYSE